MSGARLGLGGPIRGPLGASPTTPEETLADWLASVSVDRVVLAEIQPAEALTGTWTAQGPTNPQVYAYTWPSFIQTGVIPGGLYRRLDEVRQNGTLLAAQGSVAACQSVLGSYYYDQSAGTLYVSTTTGSSPAVFASVAAFFTLFVATAPMDFVGDRLYEPLLTGVLPAVSSEAQDAFTPVTSIAEGVLDLVNGHGLWDAMATAYVWRNKRVRLFLGGGRMLRSAYEQVASLRIDGLAIGDDVARLSLRSQAYLLEQTLPLATVAATLYPYAADEVVGTYRPLLWGLVRDIPALCVDAYHRRDPSFTGAPVGFADVYLVADPDAQALTSVPAVRAVRRDDGVTTHALAFEQYSVNLAACTVTVTDPTYRADQWQIRVDATGVSDGAGGYLSTAGEIAKDILRTLGAASTDIDADSFAEADAAAPFALGLWVREPVQASEVIVTLQQSVLGTVWVGRDGRWRMRVFDPSATATAGTVLDTDVAQWVPVERIDPIYPEVRVYFATNPATGEARLTTAEDSATRYLYETVDGLTVRTALLDYSAAVTMAQRYLLLAKSADVQVDVDLRGPELLLAELTDQVSVTRTRAPGGALAAQRFEILAREVRLDPVALRVRLGNLGGLSGLVGRIGVVANASVPAGAYGASTATEQATYAWWHDDNDEVTTGVGPVSLWW